MGTKISIYFWIILIYCQEHDLSYYNVSQQEFVDGQKWNECYSPFLYHRNMTHILTLRNKVNKSAQPLNSFHVLH